MQQQSVSWQQQSVSRLEAGHTTLVSTPQQTLPVIKTRTPSSSLAEDMVLRVKADHCCWRRQ